MSEAAGTVLRNGRVVTPGGVVTGGIAFEDGVIGAIGPDATLPAAAETIDVEGKVIFPGIVDPHTHMGVGDGWGQSKFESDFDTESRDAVASGITSLVTTSVFGATPRVPTVEENIAAGNRRSYVDFRITGLMNTAEHVAEIPELVALGVRSFKYYWGYKGAQAASFGMSEVGIPTNLFWVACEAMKEAHPKAFPMIHAEDPDIRYMLIERWRRRDPAGSLVSWAYANPNILEPLQLSQAAWIAEEMDLPVYMVHVSSHEAVEMIRENKAKGWKTIGETLTAFLYWTAEEADAAGLGPRAKVQPSIKFEADREALWRGINDGTITQIGTDHLMYERDDSPSDFWDTRVGLGPGMGTSFPAVVTAGLNRGRIGLEKLAEVMAENCARQYDIYPAKGVLQVGSDADVIVFDPTVGREVVAEDMESASKYSIFEGQKLYGWPELVFLRGNLVAREGKIVGDEPSGRFIPVQTPARDA